MKTINSFILLSSVLSSLLFQSCASKPIIETRHKVSPIKKNEFSSKKKNTQNSSSLSKKAESQSSLKNQDFAAIEPPAEALLPSLSEAILTQGNIQQVSKPEVSAIDFPFQPQKIGVILPLTGKNENLGKRALQAIRLGFGLDKGGSNKSLVIFDSQGNAELAAKGFDKLIKEDQVVAVLGGLSSREAQSLSQKAEFYRTPLFTFSQKSGLTDNTEYTFRNAVTTDMQTIRLIEYAIKNLKVKKVGILFPNDPYGVEFANKFWNYALIGGLEVTAAQVYDPQDTDFDIYIRKLVGTYHTQARSEEYKLRLKQLAVKKKKNEAPTPKNNRENEASENVLLPVVDFDVLFVPDSSKALGQIIAFMKNNDVQQMNYLGTNLWNTDDLIRRAGPDQQSIYFVDVNNDETEIESSEFHKKYQSTYNEPPTLVEAQVFEAASLINEALKNNPSSKSDLAVNLKSMGQRSGTYSKILMNNQKEIERPLHIFGVHEGAIDKKE